MVENEHNIKKAETSVNVKHRDPNAIPELFEECELPNEKDLGGNQKKKTERLSRKPSSTNEQA